MRVSSLLRNLGWNKKDGSHSRATHDVDVTLIWRFAMIDEASRKRGGDERGILRPRVTVAMEIPSFARFAAAGL